MQRSKHWFSAPLFFVRSTIYSFNMFAFSGACVEQGYQVSGRFGTLSLSVLKSNDKTLSSESVLLMQFEKSRVVKSLKMRHFCSVVAHDVDTVFLSPEWPRHDTGGALKNHGVKKKRGGEKKKKKKESI